MAVPPDRVLVPQILDQQEIVLEFGNRLQMRCNLKLFTIASWTPVSRANAVRQKQERHPRWRLRQPLFRSGSDALQPWKRKSHSRALQHCSASNSFRHTRPLWCAAPRVDQYIEFEVSVKVQFPQYTLTGAGFKSPALC